MKSYSHLIVALLFAKNGLCIPVDSISEKFGGHIKEMKVFSLTPNQNDNNEVINSTPKLGNDSMLTLLYRYDKAQRLLESIFGDGQGNIVERMTFKYNDKGLKSEEARYSGEGPLRNRDTYKYDDKGNVVEHSSYENGTELESKIVYKYNKAGKEISEITSKEDAGVIRRKLFEYNPHGNLIGTKEFDQRDSLVMGYDYLYDGHDNKTQEVRYTSKGEEWKYVYTYTSFDKKEKEVHIYPFKTSGSTTVWLYDDNQNMVEEIIYDYKNQVIQKSLHKYVKGRLVSEEANNSISEYEYDAAGNKVKEKVLVQAGPEGKEHRLTSERTFDKKGNPLVWTHYSPPGVVAFIEVYQYNESGKPVKYVKQYKDQGIIEQTEYLYDGKGNVIEEINKGEHQEIIRKTVTVYQYYE